MTRRHSAPREPLVEAHNWRVSGDPLPRCAESTWDELPDSRCRRRAVLMTPGGYPACEHCAGFWSHTLPMSDHDRRQWLRYDAATHTPGEAA